MKLQLVGPWTAPYSLAAGAQQSINCYLESIEAGGDGKGKYVLRGCPGRRLFHDCSGIATPIRGLWSGTGRLFVAAGAKYFELDQDGNLVGSAQTVYDDGTHSPVTMLPNSNQLLVVASGKVYCDSGLGPVQITYPAMSGAASADGNVITIDVGTPNSSTGNQDTFDVGLLGQTFVYDGTGYTVAGITNPYMLTLTTSTGGTSSGKDWSATPILTAPLATFMDGYFIVPRIQSRQWNISNLLDGNKWDPLDMALKEGYADNLASVWAEPPILYLLGTETMEMWRDTGNASFPFERVDGGFARIGLPYPWSTASVMGKLHMLAGGTYGRTVAVRMEGPTPVRISTHAVEEAWATGGGTEGYAYSYIERGHWFYVVNFAGNTNTWVYDATESARIGEPQWHERATWQADGEYWLPYRLWRHTYIPEWTAGGKHIAGDYLSGKLYEVSSDYVDEDGADMRIVRTLPYVYSDNNRVYHHRLELELETGTADTPPVIMLDWSDDRGQTFGTGEGAGTFRTLGPGVKGAYTTRYYAVGLGSSRGRVYRITIQGQGKVALIDAVLDATVGAC